jgi:excisionase family DNA binding protein
MSSTTSRTSPRGRRLWSIKGAAGELEIGYSTLRRDIRAGKVRVVRYGRRVLVPETELARIARRGMPLELTAR